MSSLTIYQGSFLYILFSRQNKPICEKIRDNSFIASDHTSGESEVNVPEVNPAPWFDLHWFHDFFLIFSFLQMLMLKQLKMRHLKKIRETDGGLIKEQDVPLT